MVISTMRLGRLTDQPLCRISLKRAGGRRRAVQVLSAKKDSSPWSSGAAKRGSGKGGGSSGKNGGSGSGPGKKAGNAESGDSHASLGPWKDVPSRRQGLPAKPSKGSVGPGGGSAAGGLSGRTLSRLAPPPPETTITDPIQVTLLDELSPTEAAAEPKWPTFCGHLSGEWVGQYAAYTPWEGKPEPAWLDERGKYINVVYTRALEYRYKYEQQQQQHQQQQQQHQQDKEEGSEQQQEQEDRPRSATSEAAVGFGGHAEAAEQGSSQGAAGMGPGADGSRATGEGEEAAEGGAVMDVLLRRIGRCTRLAALPDLRLRTPGGSPAEAEAGAGAPLEQESEEDGEGADVDVEALAFNTDGIVVFDGGNYSAGPEFIGQQEVKLVNDEAIQVEGPDLYDTSGQANGAGEGPTAAAARAAGGAAATSSAPSAGRAAAAAVYGDGHDDDDDEEQEEGDEGSTLLPTTTSVFEQCLVDWGNRTRMRLKLTLRIGQLENGEVDVQVLRILLFMEEWLGPPSSERLTAALDGIKPLARPCTELPRPTPAQLQGSWNVFTVCATGMDEVDPLSGEERVVWLYNSNEEQQLWDTSSSSPSGDDGGSFWLPGGVVLSLRMVDNYVPAGMDLDSNSSGSDSDVDSSRSAGGNGNGAAPGTGTGSTAGKVSYPRGLCLSMAWLWREGSLSVLEREYDGYGFLREVRLSQGVKGGWSGGRM